MATKLSAAAIATNAGIQTVITQGKTPTNIPCILAGESIGTQFQPNPRPHNARKHWIAHALVPTGKICLDDGAAHAITQLGKSLLAAGITAVEGNFQSQEAVSFYNSSGEEIARGLVNYSSDELQRIRGQQSENIADVLGYAGAETVVHRDNMVITGHQSII